MVISAVLYEIFSESFWRHSLDIGTLGTNNSELLVCLSVSQLAYFLTEIRQIEGNLQFWMRYLFKSFWRQSLDVGKLVPNNCEFLVCLSVCYLNRQIQEYLQFQMIYLFETFGKHSWDDGKLVPNNCEFLVCLSVCQLTYILTELDKYGDISSSG